ncbi:MAG: OmpA family protein [Bacteroidota bacterium]
MKIHPYVLRLRGHTDNAGTPAYNLQLSQKRAQSVSAYLGSHGIESTRPAPKGVRCNKTTQAKRYRREPPGQPPDRIPHRALAIILYIVSLHHSPFSSKRPITDH